MPALPPAGLPPVPPVFVGDAASVPLQPSIVTSPHRVTAAENARHTPLTPNGTVITLVMNHD
jgi:hypothetical protein